MRKCIEEITLILWNAQLSEIHSAINQNTMLKKILKNGKIYFPFLNFGYFGNMSKSRV